MTAPDDLQLPTEDERRQIFYWLKRISSYTAWNRILGFYQAWANATEKSVQIASNRGLLDRTVLTESELILILKGLSHFEEGVRRLRAGDKRVFKYDTNGEFVMGGKIPSYWHERLRRVAMGESGMDTTYTPGWNQFLFTLQQRAQANRECWPHIIQDRYIDRPAPVAFDDLLRNDLTRMTFPDALPEVLETKDVLLVTTGREIPWSGIWEPIDAPVKKGFSLFRSEPSSKGPFVLAGCMNYLHGGSPAPQVSLQIGSDRSNVDTTWRLIWRDDRYEDGTIPAEEAGYVFLMPESMANIAVPDVAASPSNTILWAESGQPAPKAGRWLVETDLQASIEIQAGEILPQHHGRHVRWILAES